jgi:hypothetical protein
MKEKEETGIITGEEIKGLSKGYQVDIEKTTDVFPQPKYSLSDLNKYVKHIIDFAKEKKFHPMSASSQLYEKSLDTAGKHILYTLGYFSNKKEKPLSEDVNNSLITLMHTLKEHYNKNNAHLLNSFIETGELEKLGANKEYITMTKNLLERLKHNKKQYTINSTKGIAALVLGVLSGLSSLKLTGFAINNSGGKVPVLGIILFVLGMGLGVYYLNKINK